MGPPTAVLSVSVAAALASVLDALTETRAQVSAHFGPLYLFVYDCVWCDGVYDFMTEGDHCALLVEDRDDTKKSFSVKKEDNVLGLACPANRTLIDKKCKAVIPAKRTPHTLFIIRHPKSGDHDGTYAFEESDKHLSLLSICALCMKMCIEKL